MNNFAIYSQNELFCKKVEKLANHPSFAMFTLRCCSSERELLQQIEGEQSVSVLMLGLDSEYENSVRLASLVKQKFPQCQIILHSTDIKKYFTAYEIPHFCFIADEDLEACLPAALNRLVESRMTSKHPLLVVKYRGKEQLVEYQEVLYLYHSDRSTYVVLTNGEELVTKLEMDEVTATLLSPPFWRCHKSYCVNWNYVKAFRRNCYVMVNGKIVPISRSKQEGSRTAFNSYLQNRRSENSPV